MPSKVIASAYFNPAVPLSADAAEDLAVAGLGTSCLRDLKNRGWLGLATGFIGIPFFSDNRRLQDAKFFLAGNPHADDEGLTFKAKKLFQNADKELTITFKFHDLSLFDFRSSLVSQYRDASDCNWTAAHPSKEDELSLQEFYDLGGCDFSVRAFALMTTKIYFNLYLVLYPRGVDDLFSEFPFAADSGFPGQLLVSYSIPLLPNADIRWGLAFFPFLLKGDAKKPFSPNLSFPIREAVACLLQTGVAPTLADSKESLLKAWAPLAKEDGAARISNPVPPFRWPDATRGDWDHPEEGSAFFSSFLILTLLFST